MELFAGASNSRGADRVAEPEGTFCGCALLAAEAFAVEAGGAFETETDETGGTAGRPGATLLAEGGGVDLTEEEGAALSVEDLVPIKAAGFAGELLPEPPAGTLAGGAAGLLGRVNLEAGAPLDGADFGEVDLEGDLAAGAWAEIFLRGGVFAIRADSITFTTTVKDAPLSVV